MKIKISILLLAFICCSQTQASQFFSLKYEKDGRDFTNQLAELKQEDGTIIKQTPLSSSWKFSMERLNLPASQHIILYGLIDKKKALLQIIDKSDISQIKSIEVAHIHNRLVAQNQLYTFYHLTEDHKHLLVHTGKKKNQNLLVIDVAAGTVTKEIPLSQFKNEVSLSTDKNYILINNTSRDELTVLRLANFSVALTSKLGESRQYGTIHNDHLYLTKHSGTKQKKQYWVQAIDLKAKNKVNFDAKSKAQPVFASSEETGDLYSISTDEKGKQVILNQIQGPLNSVVNSYEIKNLAPDSMFVVDDFNQILIKQRNRIATFDLSNHDKHAVTKLPFDTANYFYNTTGNLLYLREGSGSEVAVVDVSSGELIERSGTGRPGVKFGQFMATVALAGVTGGATGYMYIGFKYSSTGMILNRAEDKLYVINWKTNDVTQFKANDLTGRKAIATGRGTSMVYQGDGDAAPVWVFSNKQITQIDDQTFTMTKAIEYEDFVGFDLEKDYFIIKTEEQVQTYDMKSGQVINQWPMLDAQVIWSE